MTLPAQTRSAPVQAFVYYTLGVLSFAVVDAATRLLRVDYDLGTWQITFLTRIPSLVVLSACELGRSSVRWAEETLGMTTAWLHAGARCVIAAPAAVNDDEACDQLTEAHQLIAGGVPPADALSRTAPSGGSRFQCYGSGW